MEVELTNKLLRLYNLSNLLVSSKLRNPSQNNQPCSSFQCYSNCLTCNYITDGLTKINTHFILPVKHDVLIITKQDVLIIYVDYIRHLHGTLQSLSRAIHRRNKTTIYRPLQRTSQNS